MKLFHAILILFFLQDCRAQTGKPAQNQDNNTLLWEVSGKGMSAPSYIFGTFHLMCTDDIRITTNTQDAIKNADEIYFEIDLDDMSNTLGALLFMNMKNDSTLTQLYSPTQYKKIETYFKDSLGMPISMMKRFKPLLLQALLYPKIMNCKSSGVEEAVMKIAKSNNKEIKGLETLAFQASVFDSIPYTEQAKELLRAIDSTSEIKKEFDSMVHIYKTQKLDDIEKFISNSEFGTPASQARMLDDRNKNWIKLLMPLFKNKSLFVAVGAGHLPGKNGVISLLKKEGYTLRPIKNN